MPIVSGDHVYKMDYGTMVAQHHATQANLSIACIEVPLKIAPKLDIMEVNSDGRIVGFEEKPSSPTRLAHPLRCWATKEAFATASSPEDT